MAGTATLQPAPVHGTLLPQPPGGNGPGALLALGVHAALVAALTVSVDWRSRSPEVVAAELWAQVPQAAAPLAAEPPPQPAAPPAPTPAPVPTPAPPPAARPERVEPDIAVERRKADETRKKAQAEAAALIERERERERAAAAKAEADRKKAQADADRKKAEQARAEEDKLAQQRARNLERIMGQAGTGGSGTAAADAAPSSAYVGRLAAAIRRAIVYTGSVPGNAAAEVEVRAAPGGTILSRRLVKSSGHPDWDEAVLRAIDKTPRLPPDTDGRVPTWLTLVFRPNE